MSKNKTEELTMPKTKATFYTDGACSGNPGIGGWCYVEVVPYKNEYKTETTVGGSDDTTNNEMELLAAYSAILKAYREGVKEVTIYSDSAYVVNPVINSWLLKWKSNGWQTSTGKEVKNRRIWERMAKLIYEKGMYINFVKVKGHSSDLLNDLADRGATNEVERRKYEIMGM